MAVCESLGVNETTMVETINNFVGVPRRYEYLGMFENGKIYIDYAHHPTEIKAFVDTFKKENNNFQIIFQPHTFSRTKKFLKDLALESDYAGLKEAEKTAKEYDLTGFTHVASEETKVIRSNLTAAMAAYGTTMKMSYDEILKLRTEARQVAIDNGYDKVVDEVVEQLTAYAAERGKKVEFLGY